MCAEVQHFRQSNRQGDDELVGKVNKHVEERSFPQIDGAGSVIDHDEGALVRCHEAFGPRLSRSIADNGLQAQETRINAPDLAQKLPDPHPLKAALTAWSCCNVE